jgi:hypothetical protein
VEELYKDLVKIRCNCDRGMVAIGRYCPDCDGFGFRVVTKDYATRIGAVLLEERPDRSSD